MFKNFCRIYHQFHRFYLNFIAICLNSLFFQDLLLPMVRNWFYIFRCILPIPSLIDRGEVRTLNTEKITEITKDKFITSWTSPNDITQFSRSATLSHSFYKPVTLSRNRLWSRSWRIFKFWMYFQPASWKSWDTTFQSTKIAARHTFLNSIRHYSRNWGWMFERVF